MNALITITPSRLHLQDDVLKVPGRELSEFFR